MDRQHRRDSASPSASIVVLGACSVRCSAYSDTWQLVINTGTTIVTFLMVFLIQRSQNKDSLAIHLKLNEIVAALNGASNRLVDIESMSEKELAQLHRFYRELALLCRKDDDLTISHSVEEARQRHSSEASRRSARASRIPVMADTSSFDVTSTIDFRKWTTR